MHGSRWRREETGTSRQSPYGTGRLPPTLQGFPGCRAGFVVRGFEVSRGGGRAAHCSPFGSRHPSFCVLSSKATNRVCAKIGSAQASTSRYENPVKARPSLKKGTAL